MAVANVGSWLLPPAPGYRPRIAQADEGDGLALERHVDVEAGDVAGAGVPGDDPVGAPDAGRGRGGPAAHLRCRSKKSSVRRHARSADGAWYSAIGSFRSPTSVSLAKACLA